MYHIEISNPKYGIMVVIVDEKNRPCIFLNGKKITRFELLALAAKSNDEVTAKNFMEAAYKTFRRLKDPAFDTLYKVMCMQFPRIAYPQKKEKPRSYCRQFIITQHKHENLK